MAASLPLLLALAVATGAPPAAAPGQQPAPGSVEAELRYATDRAERDLREHPLRVHDPALEAYVREVACRVAGDYCGELRVYVVEQPWFNASMAPNGMMVVWTGTLLRCRDEAELAMVLGHEFAHFRQRHSLAQWRKAKRTSAFLGTFGLVAWGAGAAAAGPAARRLGAASGFGHSRPAEPEADAIGLAAAVAQGYEPAAAPRLWQRMKAEEGARRHGKPLPVFATHPRTAERLADVTAAAARLPAGGESGRDRHQAAVAPHLARWLRGELSRRMYDTSVQVVGDLLADAPPGQEALLAYYLAEAHRRRGAPGDAERAGELLARSLALPHPPAEAWRDQGLALLAAGRKEEAAVALRRYLDMAPDADDTEFITASLAPPEARR
ncbi:M48 family metalloprotease [Arenimonas sp.]|uniref:M48 family metalloprotease n=1 Tax=Arenimonas sp. TaxID=1872635 RepID=UPI0035B23959